MGLTFLRLLNYSQSSHSVLQGARSITLPNYAPEPTLTRCVELFSLESPKVMSLPPFILEVILRQAPRTPAGLSYYLFKVHESQEIKLLEHADSLCDQVHRKYLEEFTNGVKPLIVKRYERRAQNCTVQNQLLWQIVNGVCPLPTDEWPDWIQLYLAPLCCEMPSPSEKVKAAWEEFVYQNSLEGKDAVFPSRRWGVAQEGDFSNLVLKFVDAKGGYVDWQPPLRRGSLSFLHQGITNLAVAAEEAKG